MPAKATAAMGTLLGRLSKSPPCQCLLCVRGREWQSRKSGTKAQLLGLIDEIQNELCNAEFELDCLQHLSPSEATVHNVQRREAERLVIEQARAYVAGVSPSGSGLTRLGDLHDAVRALEVALKGDSGG